MKTISDEINRNGWKNLSEGLQGEINSWAENLAQDIQKQDFEEWMWELRKWNMTWRILFPGCSIPSSPCESWKPFSVSLTKLPSQDYDDETIMSLPNTEILVNLFMETVDLWRESGELDGVDEQTRNTLGRCLRETISTASITTNRGGDARSSHKSLHRRRCLRKQVREHLVRDSALRTSQLMERTCQKTCSLPCKTMNILFHPSLPPYYNPKRSTKCLECPVATIRTSSRRLGRGFKSKNYQPRLSTGCSGLKSPKPATKVSYTIGATPLGI